MGGWEYKVFRKDYCENVDGRLKFTCQAEIIEPRLQLDVDHINGDSANNMPINLQTLCKNCHAVKTNWNADYATPGRKAIRERKKNESNCHGCGKER